MVCVYTNNGISNAIAAAEFAEAVLKVTGCAVETIVDPIEPDRAPCKLMNSSWPHLVSRNNLLSSEDGIVSIY